MAGYSGTPLPRKLGITAGRRVLVVGAPGDWDLSQLDPDGATPVEAVARTRAAVSGPTPAAYDVVMAFCPDLATLQDLLPDVLRRVTEAGRLWLCWPKKASGRATDLDENAMRAGGLAVGLVDVKVCAVDATWSGLCFMTRLRDRG